ncbi:restriction endonuclease subunit S [Alistipes communis]|uniref:restriction endonuclease subunit S n=1 Tax=Alistipes communis TaxID=2585118 RepID=UPI002675FFAB|nr:restriction endonuclease subunit S [Alistipes communis]
MTHDTNIPQGYKATALGIIPQEWEVMRLEDLCHNQGDYGINAPATDFSDKLPTYLRITDIDDDGKFIIANKASVNNPNSGSYHLKDGDIVFARTGATVGKTYLYNRDDGDLVFAGFLIRFSPNVQKIVPYYLKAYTNTSAYWKWVKIASQRSSQPGINATEYCSLQIPVPPLAEQRKIAEVLGVWDEAIEKQARLIEKLALRKRALMQRLLSAKLRLPGFSSPWQKVKLGDIGDTYNGLSGKNKDDFEYGNAQFIPYINVFSNERIDTNNLGCVQIEPTEQQNTVKYGDIFFTVSSETPDEVGMASVLLEHLDNTYLNSFCFGYRLNNFSTLNPFFAAYLFRTEHFRNYMSVLAQGSTRFNISKKEVMKLKIDLPTIEEQTAIAEVLTAADREIELAKEKLERLRRQKRGLMQQLLTGKIRIKY